ncbi:MAG: SufD family Fe-S cluster assembly protein, partial [Thermoprotei archaeon]
GAGAMLTHEASIGKVAEEEIVYLMSKGFTREEAEEIVVRGFMNVEIRGVTPKIKAYISNILKLMSKRSLSG